MSPTSTEQHGVLSPEAVSTINAAYAEALDILEREGLRDQMKASLAEEMMKLARMGERGQERLCRLAVLRTLKRKPVGVVYSGL